MRLMLVLAMTEHEKRIREALEAGPTEGPFQVVRGGTYCWDIKTTDSYDVATTHGYVRNQVDSLPTANFIAACNPSAIRALLADLDAARAALSEAKAGGWLPIETCPRDFGGTKFDVWANGQRYADCWWGKATYEQGESGIVHQSDYDCNGPVDSYVKGATAWQPLPAPPAQRGEG